MEDFNTSSFKARAGITPTSETNMAGHTFGLGLRATDIQLGHPHSPVQASPKVTAVAFLIAAFVILFVVVGKSSKLFDDPVSTAREKAEYYRTAFLRQGYEECDRLYLGHGEAGMRLFRACRAKVERNNPPIPPEVAPTPDPVVRRPR
jgi:hypothetical protein